MTTAILMLVISTPAYPDADPAGVAANLRSNAALADARATAVEQLAANGWKMRRPIIMGDDPALGPGDPEDYQDVVIYFEREFEDVEADDAIDTATAAGASPDLNFSFGWNADGTANAAGHPNCEWWSETSSDATAAIRRT